tara:strand:+ start:31750 stop:31971 length:222 start_codon:yes stop_codon:yes gene_type:complete
MSNVKIDVNTQLKKLNSKRSKPLTMSALADEVGITRQTLNNWDSGERLKTLEDISKLAKFFGCSISKLIIIQK